MWSRQRLLWILLAIVLLAQLWPKGKSNPPSDPEAHLTALRKPPEDVRDILERACVDCHSNSTEWPWYTHLTPVGQWTVGHVEDARRHLNFDGWDRHSPEREAKLLHEMAEEVREEEMPLRSYLWGHPEARLDSAERAKIADWAERTASTLR